MKRKNIQFTIILLTLVVITCAFLFGDFIKQFDNSKKLRVIIVNEDIGTEYLQEEVQLGNSFVQLVEKDEEINWIVANRSRAEDMISNNQADVIVYIPNDFSEKSMQINQVNPISAFISYKINPASEYVTSRDINEFLSEFQLMINQNLTSLYFDVSLQAIESAKIKLGIVVDEQTDIHSELSTRVTDDFSVIQQNINRVVSQMELDGLDLRLLGQRLVVVENSQTTHSVSIEDLIQKFSIFDAVLQADKSEYDDEILDAKVGVGGLDEKALEIQDALLTLNAHLTDGYKDGVKITNESLSTMIDDYFRFDGSGDSETILELIDTLELYFNAVKTNKEAIEDQLHYYYGDSLDLSAILADSNSILAFESAKTISFAQLETTKFYEDELLSQVNGIDRLLYESKQSSYSVCQSITSLYIQGMADDQKYVDARNACMSAGATNFQNINSVIVNVNFNTSLPMGTYRITFDLNGVKHVEEFAVSVPESQRVFNIDASGINGLVAIGIDFVEDFDTVEWNPYVVTPTVASISGVTLDISKVNEVLTVHQTYNIIESKTNDLGLNGYSVANNQITIPQNVHDNASKLFELYVDIIKIEADLNSYYEEINNLNEVIVDIKVQINEIIVQVDDMIVLFDDYLTSSQSYNAKLIAHGNKLNEYIVTIDNFNSDAVVLLASSMSLIAEINGLEATNQTLVSNKEIFHNETVDMERNTGLYRSYFDAVVSIHEDQLSENTGYSDEYSTIFENSYQEGVKNTQLIEYLSQPMAIDGTQLEQGNLLIPYFTILLLYGISMIVSSYYNRNENDKTKTIQYLALHSIIIGIVVGMISGLLLGQSVPTLMLWLIVCLLMSITFIFVQYALRKYLGLVGYTIVIIILMLYLAVNGIFTIQGNNIFYNILSNLSVLKYYDQSLRAVLFEVPWNVLLFVGVNAMAIAGVISIPYVNERFKKVA